jgi:type II secretory pathway component PulF
MIPPYFIVFRNLDMAKFCGLWSIMMRQKTPAPEAFRIVAGMSEGHLSRALYHAAKTCEGGSNPAEALEKISSVSGMIVSAMRHIPAEKQPDEFEKMGEHFESRATDSAVKVGIIMEVLITIVCAFIAGTLVSAMFIPLVKLIEKLA